MWHADIRALLPFGDRTTFPKISLDLLVRIFANDRVRLKSCHLCLQFASYLAKSFEDDVYNLY